MRLADDDSRSKFRESVWEDAIKHIHSKGRFDNNMMTDAPVVSLINETKRVLGMGMQLGTIGHEIPYEMDTKLRCDVTMFSGFKTAQELQAVSILLYDNDKLRSFDSFKQEALRINDRYNTNYLNTEYNFAVASAQMAGKWSALAADGDDFDLQYRTAGDDKVREEHAILNRITLPASDKFWDSYFPPNGWNCRCNVVQVLKNKYETSDPSKAMAAGDLATATPKKALFRFNSGKKELIFPEKHPYYKVDEQMRQEVERAVVKVERNEMKEWARQNLVGKTKVEVKEIEQPIEFTSTGIKEALNQPHKHLRVKNRAIRHIKELIKTGEYVRFDSNIKTNAMIKGYHYIKCKIEGEDSFIAIREDLKGRVSFYSITDKIKDKKQ